jgi:hypothetical protein
MSEERNKDEKVVWKSCSIEVTPGDNPLLLSVCEIKPRKMWHTKFGGSRTRRDNNHPVAGGKGADGIDHGV